MIDTLLAQIKANLGAKAARTAQSLALAAVAMVAALVALIFFLAALFSWLELRFGTIETRLMFSGGFVVVALAAAMTVTVLRRRPTPPLNVAAAMPWDDPAMRMGLQAARTLGGRRAGTIGLVGAFVIGVILSRAAARR